MLARISTKGMLMHYWWECKLVQLLWKTVWRFLKKLKVKLTYDLVIPTTGYLPKGYKNTNTKRYMHPYVYCSIIYNSQDMEATQVSIHGWINNVYVVHTHTHTHTGILLSHKKEWNLAICITWINLKSIMLSEISQTGKDKYHIVSLICEI